MIEFQGAAGLTNVVATLKLEGSDATVTTVALTPVNTTGRYAGTPSSLAGNKYVVSITANSVAVDTRGGALYHWDGSAEITPSVLRSLINTTSTNVSTVSTNVNTLTTRLTTGRAAALDNVSSAANVTAARDAVITAIAPNVTTLLDRLSLQTVGYIAGSAQIDDVQGVYDLLSGLLTPGLDSFDAAALINVPATDLSILQAAIEDIPVDTLSEGTFTALLDGGAFSAAALARAPVPSLTALQSAVSAIPTDGLKESTFTALLDGNRFSAAALVNSPTLTGAQNTRLFQIPLTPLLADNYEPSDNADVLQALIPIASDAKRARSAWFARQTSNDLAAEITWYDDDGATALETMQYVDANGLPTTTAAVERKRKEL